MGSKWYKEGLFDLCRWCVRISTFTPEGAQVVFIQGLVQDDQTDPLSAYGGTWDEKDL